MHDGTGTVRVLVIDDNPAKRCVITHILRSGGFTVTQGATGLDGLELAKQQPDVIVLDVDLPDISGFEVCRRIKSAPDTAHIPVLHISGKFLSGEDRADGLEGGADGYLTEPVEPRELLAAIGAMVRIHTAEAGLVRANQALRAEIVERQRVESALQAAKAAAEAANNAKSEFLANMSHEIRTPMTAILGYADMLLSGSHSENERIKFLQTIRGQGEYLLSILNDILDLSKIEADKLVIERIPCNPRHLVEEAVTLLQGRATEKNLRLDFTCAASVPETIQSDPTRIRQILVNLIGNAIKFTQTGGVQVVIDLDRITDAPPRLRLEVNDTGIGLTEEGAAKLFRRFTQADGSTTRRFGGTGLGLTICQRLAEMLGGEITYENRTEGGSRFIAVIEIGDAVDVAPLDGEPQPTPAEAAIQPPPGRRRVLLAEDGIHNQKVISFYLEQAGLDVTVAENGRVARDRALAAMATDQPFDLILMDMQMPELDGYAATRQLRSEGYGGPVIAITAHAMAGDRDKCLAAGCTDYVCKPIARARLVNAIEAALRGATVTSLDPQRQCPSSHDECTTPDRTRDDIGNPDQDIFNRFLSLFLSQLPSQVEQLETALATQEVSQVREVTHQLKGSAGLYGFADVARAAEAMEQLIDAQRSLQTIEGQVQSLISMIRGIDGYGSAQPVATEREMSRTTASP